jgi:hypothetical protein
MPDHLLSLVDFEQGKVRICVIQWAEVHQTGGIPERLLNLIAKLGNLVGPGCQGPFDGFHPVPHRFVQWGTIVTPDEKRLVRYLHGCHDRPRVQPLSPTKSVEDIAG